MKESKWKEYKWNFAYIISHSFSTDSSSVITKVVLDCRGGHLEKKKIEYNLESNQPVIAITENSVQQAALTNFFNHKNIKYFPFI